MSIRILLRWLLAGVAVLIGSAAAAEPGKVTIGTYVNKVQDISFRESRYTLDFYIWFRWRAEGALADYKPLDSFELINGKIENKSGIIEKKIGDENYATARINSTIAHSWGLETFPFDRHQLRIHIEDSAGVASALRFVVDSQNSRLGDEIALPGWNLGGFQQRAETKQYKTNYGDTSLPTDALSEYSRYSFGMDMERTDFGSAAKLFSTVLAATLVAFVAFMIKPSDVDPRFGLPVGALFAVAASAFVVASAVPDSGVLTVADKMHMISMAFIFASLVQSAFCLKWDEAGLEARYQKVDRWSLVIFPFVFLVWTGSIIIRAML